MCPSENEIYMLEVLSGASTKGFAAAAGVVEDSLAAQLLVKFGKPDKSSPRTPHFR
jgi:hypothetical protein